MTRWGVCWEFFRVPEPPVYPMTCPECGERLNGDANDPSGACGACGWSERLAVPADPEDVAPRRERPKRKKRRRKRLPEDALLNPPGLHLSRIFSFLVVGLVA